MAMVTVSMVSGAAVSAAVAVTFLSVALFLSLATFFGQSFFEILQCHFLLVNRERFDRKDRKSEKYRRRSGMTSGRPRTPPRSPRQKNFILEKSPYSFTKTSDLAQLAWHLLFQLHRASKVILINSSSWRRPLCLSSASAWQVSHSISRIGL